VDPTWAGGGEEFEGVMSYEDYRNAYFVALAPEPRYRFEGSFGVTLYYEDHDAAVEYYRQVLGPPAYVEGAGTRGWPIGPGWLTLLRGSSGNLRNVEVTFQVETPAEAERLRHAFIEAGGKARRPQIN
jgi:hypothetical protein